MIVALPGRVNRILTRLEQGNLEVRNRELTRTVRTLNRSVSRLGTAVIFTGFLLGATQLYLGDALIPAAVLALGAGFSLVTFLVTRRPHR